MPRGRTYKPGKRVPGARNVGIIATSAGTFEAFVSYHGKRYTAGTHATVDEARDARDARMRELQGGGTAASLRAQRKLFSEFFEDEFLHEHYNTAAAPKRASTLRATESRYRTYIRPYFGHRALIDITSTTIFAFITKLANGAFQTPDIVEREVHGATRRFRPRRAAKPSAKTQREVLLLVRSTLAAAASRRLIPANPFPPKSIPAGRRSADAKNEPLAPNDVMKIVAAIPSLKHRCIAAVLAYGGLRLGEALSLTWGDVDFKRGYIRVERSADAKTREVGPPKTPHSVRDVPLDPALAKLLATYKKTIMPGPSPNDWMFPSERQRRENRGKPPIIDQRVFAQRYWGVARKKVTTKRITPHTARHVWCSIMVTLFPVADVSKWAGHHSPSFTYDRYVKPLERTTKGSPIKVSIYKTKETQ